MATTLTPVVETDRLRLRGHQATDLDVSMAMWNEPEVYRFIAGQPGTKAECWARLMRFAGHWALMGWGYWLVEEKETGSFVGEVGFSEFYRDHEPSVTGSMEAGWVLTPDHHGKGFATEAVSAAIGWSRDHFPALPITCLIHPDNAASIRIGEKCSFIKRCIGNFKGEPSLVMDWQG
ncbi:GNAT family N-acetyltransferase [Parvularcula sp. IMCC14364]|uniref:GNAT family N-acetyltransferase n=1 Tax=Parvularcula sp. IMCC14364 TaxID=3067902 RepID=UPI00274205BF|nr:GNAT family N-acetyltransferase [Parvularcula sp. IMCC14364]